MDELRGYDVTFLDEFRMMALHSTSTITLDSYPKLIVYDTLVPQDHPRSSRGFDLPRRYSGGHIKARVDRERSLGTVNRDGPLIADPTQAILVLEIAEGYNPQVLLVVRAQALVEHVCSTRMDVRVPWGEWGRDAVIMDAPSYIGASSTYVHGAHLMVKTSYGYGATAYCCLRTLDFSQRTCRVMPLWDVEGGGTERRASLDDGRVFVLEGYEGRISSLGNGNLYHLVSCFSRPVGNYMWTDTTTRTHRAIVFPTPLYTSGN